jgi:hypothetical protein
MSEWEFENSYNLGDFYELGQDTKRKSISDGRGTAFGWTAVPIFLSGPDGPIEFEAVFNEEIDAIQIVPKLEEFEVIGYVRK